LKAKTCKHVIKHSKQHSQCHTYPAMQTFSVKHMQISHHNFENKKLQKLNINIMQLKHNSKGEC